MTNPKIPPKPSKETIYIDIDDEITSIIDKVENSKEKILALVLPKRSTVLQSIVNMRLLKRNSDKAGKSVVLITSESSILPLAGIAGLHVAKNLQAKPGIPPKPDTVDRESFVKEEAGTKEEIAPEDKSEVAEGEELPIKIDYDKSIGELAEGNEDGPENIIELDDEEKAKETKIVSEGGKLPKSIKLKVPNFDKFRASLLVGGLGLIGLIIFIYLSISVLPKASITIKTVSTPVSASIDLATSDKATVFDGVKKEIPVALKTSDQTSTQQVAATGQQNIGDKAKGSIKMSAGDCGPTVPADVSAGTGVSTSGLTFITQQTLSFTPKISGGKCTFQSTDSTQIVAITGGAKYNIAASSFSVSGRSSVTGSSSEPTSGGTDNNQTIVSQADLDAAKAKISTASSDTFSKTFQTQLGDQGFYVIASTLKLGDPQTTSSPDVGQVSATATVTIKITYSVLVIKKDDLTAAVKNAFSSQIDKAKQKIEDTDLLKGATVTFNNQSSPTVGTLNISANALAVPIIDANTVKTQVKGQKSGDIKTNLGSITGVKSVDVKFSPFWVSKVPKNSSKITVVITHIASPASGQ